MDFETFIKKFFFFLLAPIFLTIYLILAHSYGTDDNAAPGWYQKLWAKGPGEKFIFILLAPFIFPLVWFMQAFYDYWEELND